MKNSAHKKPWAKKWNVSTHSALVATFVLASSSLLQSQQAFAISFPHSSPTPDTELLNKASHVFNALAEKATPAVVSITTVKLLSPEQAVAEGEGSPAANPFEGPAGPGGPGGAHGGAKPFEKGEQHVVGLGSGIVLRSDGIILTNSHVVDHAERIQVTLADKDDKNKYPAHLIGIDPKTDLAVIQLDNGPKNLPTLTFADSDALKVGDWAIAVGSPYGLRHSVTFGIISATGRAQMGILDTEDFIQTDAAINPGSSGGPLLDSNGQIVGVNTAIFSQGGGFSGIGFAVPSKIAKEVSEQLINHGRMIRGWIGLSAQDLDQDLAKHFRAPTQNGALISEVGELGPAREAKFRTGDVVTKYNHQSVASAAQFKSLVGKTKVGSTIPIEISRDGSPQLLSVKIEEQPGSKTVDKEQLAGQLGRRDPTLGLAVEDIPAELSEFLKIPPRTGAIVTSVRPGSPGFDAGLTPGDVILNVDQRDVHGAKDFSQATSKMKGTEASVFYVQHGPSDKTFVPIKAGGA
jgi:serine protease Do